MLNRSEARRRAENQQKIVDSRIGRYIRGEISATCLVNCPWRKTYKKTHHKNSTAAEFVMHRPRQATAAEKIKFKVRPPFKNTINVKNTSFVSMVDDLKRLKLDDGEISIKSGLKSAPKTHNSNINHSKFNANTKLASNATSKSHQYAAITNPHRKLDTASMTNEQVRDAFERAPAEIRKSVQSNFSDKLTASRGRSSSSKLHRSRKTTSHLDDSSVIIDHDSNEYISPLSEPCRCLADPDVDSFCMCQDDTLRRIIPEPGWYLKEIKKKLSQVTRNRTSKNKSVVSPDVLSFYSGRADEPESFEYWQCN